ncbi:MAG: hypothetical protein NT033_10505 [Candidatus Omnitrophica bacterium]|nr:hypothetical protein [Candidatus Omnitrophota bacterium]
MLRYNQKIFFVAAYVMIFVAHLYAYDSTKSLILIKARGRVNLNEIGGKGLYAFSLWDKNRALIGNDGSFTTVISNFGPQKIMVKDDRQNTRAMAIVLPEDPQGLVFDAKSTAIAILLQDPGLLESSDTVNNISSMMTDKKSFKDLIVFFKKNLPHTSLQELADNAECISLLERCNAEIFGEDKEAINKSLNEAESKLQKIFQEK